MNILLLEDDLRLSELIKKTLEEEGYKVMNVYDGEMAYKIALQQDFDLIISDVIVPKINGLDFCKKIKTTKPQVPVLMLTALGTTDDKVEGFDAGADDYMVKPFEFREFLARIKALSKRKILSKKEEETVLKYADIELNKDTKLVSRAGKEISLTPKEFNLLSYFLINPERVISKQEIAEKVWNTFFDTGTNYIDVYINYLRKKIDKPFDKQLIHTKSGMGFILREEN